MFQTGSIVPSASDHRTARFTNILQDAAVDRAYPLGLLSDRPPPGARIHRSLKAERDRPVTDARAKSPRDQSDAREHTTRPRIVACGATLGTLGRPFGSDSPARVRARVHDTDRAPRLRPGRLVGAS